MGTREILTELQRKLDETIERHAHHTRLAEEAQRQGDSLRVVIAMYAPADSGSAPDNNQRAVSRQSDGPERLHPLVEPIELILTDAGRPLHLNAIYDELVKLDVPVAGKAPTNTISSVLSRHKERFMNTGRGMWAMKPAAAPSVQLPEAEDRPAESSTPYVPGTTAADMMATVPEATTPERQPRDDDDAFAVGPMFALPEIMRRD